jgi:hypothetical protein
VLRLLPLTCVSASYRSDINIVPSPTPQQAFRTFETDAGFQVETRTWDGGCGCCCQDVSTDRAVAKTSVITSFSISREAVGCCTRFARCLTCMCWPCCRSHGLHATVYSASSHAIHTMVHKRDSERFVSTMTQLLGRHAAPAVVVMQ